MTPIDANATMIFRRSPVKSEMTPSETLIKTVDNDVTNIRTEYA